MGLNWTNYNANMYINLKRVQKDGVGVLRWHVFAIWLFSLFLTPAFMSTTWLYHTVILMPHVYAYLSKVDRIFSGT